jgi:hypothetical protein
MTEIRFPGLSWKDMIKQVDGGIDYLLHYCEDNRDWLKAIEANKLLQSKINSFASLLDKFAMGSVDSNASGVPIFGVGTRKVIPEFPSTLPNSFGAMVPLEYGKRNVSFEFYIDVVI